MKETKERPTIFADKIGRIYAENCNDSHKKNYGQYLTPVEVADLMANMHTQKGTTVRILDAGIGSTVLTCALCESIIKKNGNIKEIEVVGYEMDESVIPTAKKALKYLKEWVNKREVIFNYQLKEEDFVLKNAPVMQDDLSLFNTEQHETFDVIISNPPYFKLNKNDPRAMAASKVVYGQPNIYSLFMAISAFLLNSKGDLIFITPRSYTAGNYFKAFREVFFSNIIPIECHLFGSRKKAFDRDAVLQEHLILHGKRRNGKFTPNGKRVQISFCEGISDIPNRKKRKTLLKDVVDYHSPNRIISLPITEEEENIVAKVCSWNGSLHKYGMEISTGKVVPFRAINLIHTDGELNKYTAPLIWMNHIRDGKIEYPLESFRKQQYILIADISLPILVPNLNYVLMRRFSAKEEHRRLNTCPYFKDKIECEWLGLENHVNYIYSKKGELSINEAFGLSAVLNSKILDTYFRVSNGNTEVSATEIRNMPLPDLDTIVEIGKQISRTGKIDLADKILIEK